MKNINMIKVHVKAWRGLPSWAEKKSTVLNINTEKHNENGKAIIQKFKKKKEQFKPFNIKEEK